MPNNIINTSANIEPVGAGSLYPTITETDVQKQMQTGVARDIAISQLLNPKPAGDKQYDTFDTTGNGSDIDTLRAQLLEKTLAGPDKLKTNILQIEKTPYDEGQLAAQERGKVRAAMAGQTQEFYETQTKQTGTQKALLSKLGVLPTATGGASAAQLAQKDLATKQKREATEYERYLSAKEEEAASNLVTKNQQYLNDMITKAYDKIKSGYEDYEGQITQLKEAISGIEKQQMEEIKVAKQDFKDMIKSPGFDITKFDDNQVAQWAQLTGQDPNMLKFMAVSMAPQAEKKLSLQTTTVGNNLVYSIFNPATGELEQKIVELPGAPKNIGDYEKVVTKDGQLMFVNPATKDVWSVGKTGMFGEEKTTNLPTSIQEYEYAQKNPEFAKYLNAKEEVKNMDTQITEIGGRVVLVNKQTGETQDLGAKSTGQSSEMLTSDYKNWLLAGQPGSFQNWIRKLDLKPLPANEARQLSEGEQLDVVINPLYEILESKANVFGPIEGLKAYNPWDIKHKTVDDDLRRASQTIGRFMEGGVLRKEDEEKYRKMLPQITDTIDVAKDKLNGVTQMVKEKQKQYIEDFANSGYDVSRFLLEQEPIQEPTEFYQSYEEVKQEIPDITSDVYEEYISQKKKTSSVSIPETSLLAYSNNNPGNLRYAGQKGAVEGSGGFAKFNSPEAGLEALKRQIKLDTNRGLTLEKFIYKYAPPEENDTEKYIGQMEQWTGHKRGEYLKNINLNELTKAIAKKESGTKIYV